MTSTTMLTEVIAKIHEAIAENTKLTGQAHSAQGKVVEVEAKTTQILAECREATIILSEIHQVFSNNTKPSTAEIEIVLDEVLTREQETLQTVAQLSTANAQLTTANENYKAELGQLTCKLNDTTEKLEKALKPSPNKSKGQAMRGVTGEEEWNTCGVITQQAQEIALLRSNLEELEITIANSREEIRRVQAKNAELTTQVKKLGESQEKPKRQNQPRGVHQTTPTLQSKLDAANEGLSKAKSEVLEKDEEITRLTTELNQVKLQAETRKKDDQASLARLQARVRGYQETMAKMLTQQGDCNIQKSLLSLHEFTAAEEERDGKDLTDVSGHAEQQAGSALNAKTLFDMKMTMFRAARNKRR